MSEEAATRFFPDNLKRRRSARNSAANVVSANVEPVSDEPEQDVEDEVSDPIDDSAVESIMDDSATNKGSGQSDDRIDRLFDVVHSLQRDNAALQRANTDLQRELEGLRGDKGKVEKKPRISVDVEGADIDEAKLNEEFPTLLPTVRAIARREVKVALDKLAPQLERLFAETDEAVGSVRSTQQQAVKSSFERSIRSVIPDLDAINRDREFNEYIDGRAPMQPAGVTIRAVLSYAWKNQDIDTISEIIGGFKSRKAQPKKKANAVDDFVQPTTPRNGAPTARNPNMIGKLKSSDWADARRKLSRGEMSPAEYAPIKRKFEKAQQDGRLVDDIAQ